MLKERWFLIRFEEDAEAPIETLVLMIRKALMLHVTGFKPVDVTAIKTDWKKDENL